MECFSLKKLQCKNEKTILSGMVKNLVVKASFMTCLEFNSPLSHFFVQFSGNRPAFAMLLMFQMPFYSLFKTWIFRHPVFQMPLFVDFHVANFKL